MNATTAALNDPASTQSQDQGPAPAAPKLQAKDGGGNVLPKTFFVLDTTAIPGKGSRDHAMIVLGLHKSFKFEPGIPLEMPIEIAIKFLRHDAFKLTDKDGNPLPYHRQPRQPDELGAGEKLELNDHQTVADYGELTNMALLQRALELPGGEMLKDKGDRQSLTDFIIRATVARRKLNASKEADRDADSFLPDPEA
jgi:hypothetical protein